MKYQRRIQRLGTSAIHTLPSKPSSAPQMTCFNCDERDHRIHQCPKPINATKAAMRRIEHLGLNQNAICHVLFDSVSKWTHLNTKVDVKARTLMSHHNRRTFL
eukprot:Plantae.Rhodophyta-Rhodochaete_pulchella.ctg27616.p2 GENE.Plantae.Rhodophyta-Rhodochaete_pulchella.ctg27616~~Plantae.Rhodophyta-Rhodochaete_pulchella.ctg27616.p2  ORF type:complete len:103 (+),score=4.95 Plantae.Rhodophyta-Rhodochaete_pulchella.ctg27616:439-747(+)